MGRGARTPTFRVHGDKYKPGEKKVILSVVGDAALPLHQLDRAGIRWPGRSTRGGKEVDGKPLPTWGWKQGMVAGLIVGTIAGGYIGVMERSFLEAIPPFLGAFLGMTFLMAVVGPAQDRLIRAAMRRLV